MIIQVIMRKASFAHFLYNKTFCIMLDANVNNLT